MLSLDVDIRQRLRTARIPPMPQILMRLIAQCQADRAGTAELAELIASDSAIAARVMEVANSSAYHRKGPCSGIHQALMTMGTDAVKMLLINESVIHVFGHLARERSVDLSRFWKHSLAAALIARRIAHRIGYAQAEEAYLAGLLHDIGRLALLAAAPEEYGLNFDAEDDDALCASEERTLQITHPEAGALLVERWELDSFIADSVLYHHEPPARVEGAHPLIRIVLLAHLIAAEEAGQAAFDAAATLCGLTEAEVSGMRDDVAGSLKTVAQELGIDLSAADRRPVPKQSMKADAADPLQQRMAQDMQNLMLSSEMSRFLGTVDDEAQLHAAMTQAACILFNTDDAAILIADDRQQSLAGTDTGRHNGRVSQYRSYLSTGGPLAAAVRNRQIVFVTADSPSLGVPEEQLLRIMGAECVVLVPIVFEQRCLGVLVGAMPRWRVAMLQERESFLAMFGAQAGQALSALRAAAQEAEQQAEAVASRFRIASRQVAHEVNNPLSIIRNYLGVLDHKLTRDEPVQAEISILNDEIDRVGHIVSGLGNLQIAPFSAAGSSDVNLIIDGVVRTLRETAFAPSGVAIATRCQETLPQAAMASATLRQVMLNLLKNAVEAVGARGTIEVGSRGPSNRDGSLFLEIWVRDDGPGIPAHRLQTLFTEIRSSKEGGNRGLGLTIVHRLVKEAGGFIACRSEPGGTTFELLLPATAVAPAGSRPEGA